MSVDIMFATVKDQQKERIREKRKTLIRRKLLRMKPQ